MPELLPARKTSQKGSSRLPYTKVCATAMERFGLTRIDLMLMSWSQVVMLFDATYEEEQDSKPSSVHEATDDELRAWI